jgi:hypothetical protein
MTYVPKEVAGFALNKPSQASMPEQFGGYNLNSDPIA